MNIKETREKVNMTRKEVVELIGMPYRTLQDWELSNRKCPDYIERLIVAEILRHADKNGGENL